MSSKLLNHLLSRPTIASVVRSSNKICNVNALKLMCILDHQLEIMDLYPEITVIPKLSDQLLKFHSFVSFNYVTYKLPNYMFGNKVLQCKHCGLIGPYLLVLEHMVISHNVQANAKRCMWCERLELNSHVTQNSLNQCYNKYMENISNNNNNQQFGSVKYPKIIKTFYRLVKTLAKELHAKNRFGEHIITNDAHENNKNHESILPINATNTNNNNSMNHEDSYSIDTNLNYYQHHKEINSIALDVLYKKTMVHFYGVDAHEYFHIETHSHPSGWDRIKQIGSIECSLAGLNGNSNFSNFTIEIDPAQVDMSQSPSSHFETSQSTTNLDVSQPSSHPMEQKSIAAPLEMVSSLTVATKFFLYREK